MSNPGSPLRAVLFAVAMLPAHAGPAHAGVTAVESRDAPRSAAYQRDPRAQPAYVLRCWQIGRLLFEEPLHALPADGTRYAIKAAGNDRHGRPVYVAETSNATCLIKSSGAGPAS